MTLPAVHSRDAAGVMEAPCRLLLWFYTEALEWGLERATSRTCQEDTLLAEDK